MKLNQSVLRLWQIVINFFTILFGYHTNLPQRALEKIPNNAFTPIKGSISETIVPRTQLSQNALSLSSLKKSVSGNGKELSELEKTISENGKELSELKK